MKKSLFYVLALVLLAGCSSESSTNHSLVTATVASEYGIAYPLEACDGAHVIPGQIFKINGEEQWESRLLRNFDYEQGYEYVVWLDTYDFSVVRVLSKTQKQTDVPEELLFKDWMLNRSEEEMRDSNSQYYERVCIAPFYGIGQDSEGLCVPVYLTQFTRLASYAPAYAWTTNELPDFGFQLGHAYSVSLDIRTMTIRSIESEWEARPNEFYDEIPDSLIYRDWMAGKTYEEVMDTFRSSQTAD